MLPISETRRQCIIRIAAQEYFAKPMHALFKSLELAAYDLTNLDVSHPALDLGCGIGSFGSVFCEFKGLSGFEIGSDLRIHNVRQSSGRGTYRMVLQSDARALPIKTGTLKFILCSSVLHGISPGYDLALAEIGRVLAPGGRLGMSVATPRFTTALLANKWLNHLGFQRLAASYSRRTNVRNGHQALGYLTTWQQAIERVGLELERHIYYFSSNEAAWWSLLALRPVQIFATFRYLPYFMQRFTVCVIEKFIRNISAPVCSDEKDCGYLLIVAKKR